MNAAFLSLGGNMGNRAHHLEAALNDIKTRCGRVTRLSSVYETEAWGITSEKKHLNQVVQLETGLEADALLQTLQDIEHKAGRVREGQQYGDRVIDLDILFFNHLVVHRRELWIPHPRLHLRRFVLVPMTEIAGDLVHPELNQTMAQLLKDCEDRLAVEKYLQ